MKYKPVIKLLRETGNVEALKHNIKITLKRAKEEPRVKEFLDNVAGEKNYDRVLEKAKNYVEIKDHRGK